MALCYKHGRTFGTLFSICYLTCPKTKEAIGNLSNNTRVKVNKLLKFIFSYMHIIFSSHNTIQKEKTLSMNFHPYKSNVMNLYNMYTCWRCESILWRQWQQQEYKGESDQATTTMFLCLPYRHPALTMRHFQDYDSDIPWTEDNRCIIFAYMLRKEANCEDDGDRDKGNNNRRGH